MADIGFTVAAQYFSNHHAGAMQIFTRSPGKVRRFADPSHAVDDDARRKILNLRRRMMVISWGRMPALLVESAFLRKRWSVKDIVSVLASLPVYLPSKLLNLYWRTAACREWDTHKTQPHGSEMFMVFTRRA